MAIHCAQCHKALAPAHVHRCNRCGLPYCRTHIRRHECEHVSREDLASWATTFEKGADEERGELPTGPTYRPVSGAKLFSAELGGALMTWLVGLGLVLSGLFAALPYEDALIVAGLAVSLFGALFLARTFARMHELGRFTTFVVFLVFVAVPFLVVVGSAL